MAVKTDHLSELIPGLLCAVVTDNQDEKGLNRVQVKYVVPSGEILSAWARMMTKMGGPEMGLTCLPEPDDEVLLRFVNGQPDQPVIIGAVHNGKDVIPFDNGDGKNDERIWYSRSDHHIIFNDGDGAEFVQVETKDGKTNFKMDTASETIDFFAVKDIVLKIGNNLLLDAGTDVVITAGANYTHQAGSNQEMTAGSNIDISGSAGVAITSAAVSFKA
jgi:uncharacterized protein involved in type VI secretion and phage assembly